MGLNCNRTTYMCAHDMECEGCKHNHALATDDYIILKETSKTIQVRAGSHSAARRLLGCKQMKIADDGYVVTNCLFNKYILGVNLRELAEGDYFFGAELWKLLYPYQREDMEKYGALPFVLNANLMGYGKTIEGIAYARMHGCKNVLIIVPKSVILQWAKEIGWVWRSRAKDIMIIPKKVKEGTNIVIVNYDKFSQKGNFVDYFKNFVWDVIICDEVHRIKNRTAQRTIQIKSIPGKRKMGLTGTPILRRVDDLWSICDWLNPKLFGGSYWNFTDLFMEYDETFFGKKPIGNTKDERAITDLNNFLKLFTIRRPEIDVGCGSREASVVLEMFPQVSALYKGVKANLLQEIEDISILNAASKLIRLRQLASNPGLFNPAFHKLNPKFHWIKDLLDDNPEIKVVVFSNFTQTILALQSFLDPGQCIVYHGEMTMTMRDLAITRFQINNNVQVLAGTVGAMGQGVDGLQNASHTVIFLDRDWSPEIVRQAQARLIRNGQEFFVNIYNLECDKTIDQHISRMNELKLEDIRRILDDA